MLHYEKCRHLKQFLILAVFSDALCRLILELEFLNKSGFAKLLFGDFSTGSAFYIAYLGVVPSENVKSMNRKKEIDL